MTEQMTGYRVSFTGLFAGQDPDGVLTRPTITGIEIPVIQRDYAQGRELESVRNIRSSFLDALRAALTDGPPLNLDFVYGDVSATDATFRPLDGQQRLTTLFLLHWYVAQRAGVDLDEVRWASFSYATRHSSRRFLEELVKATLPHERGTVAEWVRDQPWFHYGWENDPTIRSMLVMLDAIEESFGPLDAANLWERLTSQEAPAVSFYVLPIEEMGQGDVLYIKMNSRGKPLTPFENFKALFEKAVEATAHGDEIAHKIDGPWSEVMWPYRGDDDIVDDEFMKYFTFLIEVGEWRADAPSEGRLIDRAEQLYAGVGPQGEELLDFFVRAMDTWVGVDVEEYVQSLFREPGTMEIGESRPTLFTPDHLSGVNLFALASAHYGSMRSSRVRAFPLGLTILLYAVIIHRLNETPDFPVRLRSLRNVVEASDDEIRAERMHRILMDVERFLGSGELAELKSFNQAQVKDEVRKREFLADAEDWSPDRDGVYALEDHSILRGSLFAFALDSQMMVKRARAFERMFADSSTWPSLTGAFLTVGDYFRKSWTLSYYFGSPSTEGRWRLLLSGGGKGSFEDLRRPWSEMLDEVAKNAEPLSEMYEARSSSWLARRREQASYDWRYHLVAYPEMREGESGLYVTEDGSLNFELCALRRMQMNSYYRDPYLYAIYRRSRLSSSLENPWYSGYSNHPRWLRVTGSELAVRCRNHGFDIRCPGQQSQVVAALQELPGQATVAEDHVVWWAPQADDETTPTDTVDRVEVGCEIVRHLVALAGEPGLQSSADAGGDLS